MTKRAGKRKYRMGSQRHPPGKITTGPSTLEVDHLPERESINLELRAINAGWILQDGASQTFRDGLIRKAIKLGLESKDDRTVVAAFRAVSMVELKQQQLILMEKSLQIREQNRDLPGQVDGQVFSSSATPERPAHEIVQELIARKDIRDALDRRPSSGVHKTD